MPTIESFVFHGFVQQTKAGNQAIGKCPFCMKDSHFYINAETLCWDCKRCGTSGNFERFLDAITKNNELAMDDAAWRALAVNRGLPRAAYTGWRVGTEGNGHYTFSILGHDGKVLNVKRWKLGGKLYGTKDVEVQLYGLHNWRAAGPVYLCEGEHDTVALKYLVDKVGAEGVVLGIPGAGQLPPRWFGWFQDRVVYALYDKDEAGEKGAELCRTRLGPVAKRLSFVHWPDTEQPGFDTRDWVTRAVKNKTLKQSWIQLQTLFMDRPPGASAVSVGSSTQSTTVPAGLVVGVVDSSAVAIVPVSYRQACETYNKWLSLKNNDAIKVMFGTVFANRLDGDPVWMFLVGAPGSAKSELLLSLAGSDEVIAKSTLTAASLISGWNLSGGGPDNSLIPKLNNKVLAVKDFTAVLGLNGTERDQIFGTLRDAFDGRIEKAFGTGNRAYVSKFGIIAGCTPIINSVAAINQSMGERFVKFAMDETDAEQKIRAAISNIDKESNMRSELQTAAAGVLAGRPDKPTVDATIIDRVVPLARFCAVLRGSVDRERNTNLVTHIPTAEVGTRVAKQLTKLAFGLAMVDGNGAVGLDDYRIIKQVAICSCPDRSAAIVYKMYTSGELTLEEIIKGTRLNKDTVVRIISDLILLRSVNKIGLAEKATFKLSDQILDYIKRSEVYASSDTITKPTG